MFSNIYSVSLREGINNLCTRRVFPRSLNSRPQISSKAFVYVHLLCIRYASDLAEISHSRFLVFSRKLRERERKREISLALFILVTNEERDEGRRTCVLCEYIHTGTPRYRVPPFPVSFPECSRPAGRVQRPHAGFSLPLALFSFHAAPSPSLSRTVYLRWQRGHFYLLPLLSLSLSSFSADYHLSSTFCGYSPPPPPFLLLTTDYFGRAERIHYASVQFADFRDPGKGGVGGKEGAAKERIDGGEEIRRWKFEKEENSDCREVGERKMDRYDGERASGGEGKGSRSRGRIGSKGCEGDSRNWVPLRTVRCLIRRNH